MAPALSVVIPTRNRARYLEVALDSLAGQSPLEIVVVDDASADETPAVAARHAVRLIRQPVQRGLNAARNAGVRATSAPLIAFLDDDVIVWPSWAAALVEGARRHPQAEAFGGPIRARLEGSAPRSCGREKPPITTLDLGPVDRTTNMVWGANMAIGRSAFERTGGFDETIGGHGDEEDWLRSLRDAGGEIVYLAGAGVEHRRVGEDARLRALTRAAYGRGRSARTSDERRGEAPTWRREALVVAGCAWHVVHYRCPQGVIMGAHAAGRLIEAVR